jgi:hypothetical protein
MWRTYDFSVEVSPTIYNEAAVSWAATIGSGNSVLNRIVFPLPVTVNASQKLRLYYQLNVMLAPTASAPRPNVTVTGWPVGPSTNTNGSESIQYLSPSYGISSINADGTIYANGNRSALEPSDNNSGIFISTNSASLATYGTGIGRATGETWAVNILTNGPYITGSYTLAKTATFSAVSFNASNLRSMGLGATGGAASQNYYAFVFDQPQTKTNTQTLTLSFVYSWGRVLA